MNDALFPEGKDQKRAKAICMGCPVRAECLAEALDNRIEWGVWGGMTERERRQLLRQRPDVQSWAAVLEAAAAASQGVKPQNAKKQTVNTQGNTQGAKDRSVSNEQRESSNFKVRTPLVKARIN